MNNIEAYNKWSEDYDKNKNKTRDLEALALRSMLNKVEFENVLEIGCGTGKNTEWLSAKARYVTGADFSEEMLSKAKHKHKIKSNNVKFVRTDVREEWNFEKVSFNLITFSLVLEHIAAASNLKAQRWVRSFPESWPSGGSDNSRNLTCQGGSNNSRNIRVKAFQEFPRVRQFPEPLLVGQMISGIFISGTRSLLYFTSLFRIAALPNKFLILSRN